MSNICYTLEEAQYLGEIAYIIGSNVQEDDRVYGMRFKLWNDSIEYDEMFEFYLYVLNYCKSIKETDSLLETIHTIVDSKEAMEKMFETFLSIDDNKDV